MQKKIAILSVLLLLPITAMAANQSSGGNIGTGGGDLVCVPRDENYVNVNFYGLSSSGVFTLLKSVKFNYNKGVWPCVSSGLSYCTGNASNLSGLQVPLTTGTSSITYDGTTYKKGLSAYAALFAGAGNDDLGTPNVPNQFISTTTSNKITPSTTNLHITKSSALPDLSSKVTLSDGTFATQVNYVLVYAANCLDPDGTTSGATCSLTTTDGRAVYSNTCLNGTSAPSAFGSTSIPAASSVTVKNSSYNTPCS